MGLALQGHRTFESSQQSNNKHQKKKNHCTTTVSHLWRCGVENCCKGDKLIKKDRLIEEKKHLDILHGEFKR